jgi:nicotinamidase-related amidase
VEEFNRRIENAKLKKIILIGVESHVCVYQTCFSLVKKGYELHVPRDAVDSRKGDDLAAGLELMRDCGATVTSTEAVVFQLLKKAGTREFKEMLKIIR